MNLKILLQLSSLLLIACACTIPPKRVSSGAVVPHGVMLDATRPGEGGRNTAVQIGLGGGKGESISDNGHIQFGTHYGFSFEFSAANFWAIGARPYLATSDYETTARTHFSYELYQRFKIINTRVFRLYLYNALRSAQNADSDDEATCFLWCESTGGATSSARVEILEVSAAPIIEFFVGRNSIALVPEVMWRHTKTENRHPTLGSYNHSQKIYDLALGFYYGVRFGERVQSVLQIGGGYKTRKGFGDEAGVTKPGYYGDLQYRIAFGGGGSK